MPATQQQKIPLTPATFKKIKERHAFVTKLRVEVMARLQVARDMGDLSENGAYKYAKFELGNIGRELKKLNFLIENGVEGTIKESYEKIEFGCTFVLQNGDKTTTYMLVSEHEADPTEQKISWKSPIGEAVLHKTVGDSVVVKTPRGEQTFTVMSL